MWALYKSPAATGAAGLTGPFMDVLDVGRQQPHHRFSKPWKKTWHFFQGLEWRSRIDLMRRRGMVPRA
jgi:hypothetical protein